MAGVRKNKTLQMLGQIKELLKSGKLSWQELPIEDLLSAVRLEILSNENTYTREQFADVMSGFEDMCEHALKHSDDPDVLYIILDSLAAYLSTVSEAVLSLSNKDYWLSKHYEHRDDPELLEVINEIDRRGDIRLLNYRFVDDYMALPGRVLYDAPADMSYVEHQGKKMYFPRGWTEQRMIDYYHSLLAEQDGRSPHCYRKNGFDVEEDDVIVDVGAAEGIFSLERIDRVKKAYLIEADSMWVDALKMTFLPYMDKIEIITAYIGDDNEQDGYTTLDSLFAGMRIDYIKMDIEGYEKAALRGGEKVFDDNVKLRCAICAYHCREDEQWIKEYLESKGYRTDTSRGYMCPDWCIEGRLNAELRRGIVFGSKC